LLEKDLSKQFESIIDVIKKDLNIGGKLIKEAAVHATVMPRRGTNKKHLNEYKYGIMDYALVNKNIVSVFELKINTCSHKYLQGVHKLLFYSMNLKSFNYSTNLFLVVDKIDDCLIKYIEEYNYMINIIEVMSDRVNYYNHRRVTLLNGKHR
jgi:hypothetical protein